MPTTTTGLATSFIQFSRPGASGGGATVTDADGKIKWAGHNLLTNSESFDASAWVKGGNTTITPNVTSSPIGTTTADRISVTITGGQAQSFQITVSLVAATYTAGCFLKADTASTWAALNLYDAALTNKRVWFNLNTGAKGTEDSGITGTITPLSNGWYYCSVSRAVTGASGGLSVEVTNNDNVTTGTAGNAIYAWGAHLYRSDLGGMQLNPAMPAGMQSYYPTTPRNLLGYTEDFSNNAIWGAGAYGTANSVVGPNGLQTADTIAFTAALKPSISQTISSGIVGGSTYTISVWAKASSTGTPATSFRITTNNTAAWSTGVTQKFTLTSSWQRFSVTGVIASSGTAVRVLIGATNLDGSEDSTCLGSVDLYGIQLSDSASLDTYVPVYGAAVTSAAYYAPRLDFDGATLSPKGLLVEEQRVNVLQHSNAITTSPWQMLNTATASQNAIGPDGVANSAWTLTDSDATARGGYYQSYTVANNSASHVASGYFKKTSGAASFPAFQANIGGGSSPIIGGFTLNTDTGVATAYDTNSGTVSAAVTNCGDYWRIAVTVTNNSTGNTTLNVVISAAVNTTGGAAWSNATTGFCVFYGAQLEANASFATSYIPNGSAVAGATRTADVASVSTQAFPYSASEGTLVVSAVVVNRKSVDYPRIAALYGSTVNEDNTVGIGQWSATALSGYVSVSGSPVADISQTVSAYGTNVKGAIAYKVNDFAFSANGAAASTDTSGAVPSAATVLVLGSNTVNQIMNGWVRQVTYLPRRLTNAELQSRTA